ncbi:MULTISPECIES: hypothetical protein [Raoultella]|uniref:hypothetical protein n=1 Tax=Raoultella TaxID=160674 RepID=UPI001D0227C3|nr:hypothetical protein [Raoultella ornithinolytica]
MTNNQLTREENVQAVFDLKAGYTLGLADVEILKRVARMALAAMDSEPRTDDELSNLLWFSQEATCHSDPNYFCEFQRLAAPGLIAGIIRELQERLQADSEPVAEVLSRRPGNDTSTIDRALPVGTQLYRHTQQPLVPEKAVVGEMPFLGASEGVYVRGWNDCRAAMLQELPKSAGESNNCRSGEIVQVLQGEWRCSTKSAPALDSLPKNTESRCGNSPVIPDGYVMVPKEPTPEILAVISEAIRAMRGSAATYARVLAAAPQEVKGE